MTRQGVFPGVRLLTFLVAAGLAQAQSPPLSIRIAQGDHAINSIKLRQGHDPIVQVMDASGAPIAGAAVTFMLPASGPGATFPDQSLSITVPTDSQGMAAARGLKPNRLEGQFRIRVIASWRGESANATVMQTNAEPVAKSSSSKWVIIAVVAGGAVAGGAVAAMHGGGGSSGSTTPPSSVTSSTIVPGTPSFGPPK